MTNIDVVRVVWGGVPGGASASTFHVVDVAAAFTPIHDLFGSLLNHFPGGISFTVEPVGDIIETTTGEITGSWTHAAGSTMNGSGVGGYAAPVGVALTWLTGAVIKGRRVKGRTYMVPTVNGTFDTDGTLTAGAKSDFEDAASGFVTSTASNLVVYHRPTSKGGTDGQGPFVTGSLVRDKAAILRSRRD